MCMQEWEKQKIIYEEQCQSFRALQEILWKIPVIAMTLTGGLWFGVATLKITNEMRVIILLLSALSNLVFIIALFRVRQIMARYLKEKCKFEGRSADFGFVVVTLFAIILLFSCAASIYVICNMSYYFVS